MLTTKWLLPNRAAVGKATYNLRNLNKNVLEMDIPDEIKNLVTQRVSALEHWLKHGTFDEDQLGNVVHVSG